MPKRPYDFSAMPASDRVGPVKVQKTERSHEENQERAYIAASRRADRSLEARVQSARQASEIHRRRTGRGLKVSEEIVLKEEMYEEEEDDLPRHYRYLTSHLQTNSTDMNNRVNAYITTQTAMATMARYNEVNRLFSESFPSAAASQQHLNSSAYMPPNSNGNYPHRLSTSGSSQDTPATPATRTHSVSSQSQFDRRDSINMGSPALNPGTAMSSPPALTPGSSTTDASETKSTPYQTPASFSNIPLDPQLLQQSSSSVFTSELSNDVKMLANIDMNDPMAMHFMGEDPGSYQMFGPYPGDTTTQEGSGKESADHTDGAFSPQEGVVLDNLLSFEDSMSLFDIPTDFSRLGTPAAGVQGDWENFVDFGSDQ
ncbi:hypothetical protein F4818DRAFT_276683 [Hypoxylon cercidicola]|nr:hypothetical protein F4818DRAFT_276683 [Hypoxylon cercidicola]